MFPIPRETLGKHFRHSVVICAFSCPIRIGPTRPLSCIKKKKDVLFLFLKIYNVSFSFLYEVLDDTTYGFISNLISKQSNLFNSFCSKQSK